MKVETLLSAIHVAEKLKDTTRHCYTSKGRHESVAEHSWRISLMAMWIKDEFPQANMNRVIQMCLIHDLGECFTGDIPSFLKTAADEQKEEELLYQWVNTLDQPTRDEMMAMYQEMEARETLEAKIYKAMDALEAVISHNESGISTWAENEYDLNRVYGWDKVEFSDYLKEFRKLILQETEDKIAKAK